MPMSGDAPVSPDGKTATIDRSATELERVVIRFAGDSGDGMQLSGTQLSTTSAVYGNDVSTLPDFPSEIRAPAGSRAGVSGFQIHFSSHDIYTPGDAPSVLVAMNPAALKAELLTTRHAVHGASLFDRLVAASTASISFCAAATSFAAISFSCFALSSAALASSLASSEATSSPSSSFSLRAARTALSPLWPWVLLFGRPAPPPSG